MAWCVGLAALFMLARAIADPPVPGLHDSIAAACLTLMTAGCTVGAVIVVVAGVPCAAVLVVGGLRRHQPRVWRALVGPPVGLALWLAATVTGSIESSCGKPG